MTFGLGIASMAYRRKPLPDNINMKAVRLLGFLMVISSIIFIPVIILPTISPNNLLTIGRNATATIDIESCKEDHRRAAKIFHASYLWLTMMAQLSRHPTT